MSRRKLLLADDSITIQKVVNLTFADEGIDVVTVGDGDAALAHLTVETPDILLADVNMPGPTGYQICEQLRSNEATKDVPVILLVGSFEPFDETEAARVGANAYLTKPFQSIKQLIAQVNELIDASKPVAAELSVAETAPLAASPDSADAFTLSNESWEPEKPVTDTQPAQAVETLDTTPRYFDDLGYETSVQTPPVSAQPDDDIDDLYTQSIDRGPEDLSDVGIDDEMIETSYAAADANLDLTDFTPEAAAASSQDGVVRETPILEYRAADISDAEAAIEAPVSEPLPQSEENRDTSMDTVEYHNWKPADMRDESYANSTNEPEPASVEASDDPTKTDQFVTAAVGEDTIKIEDRFDSTGGLLEFDEVDLLDLTAGSGSTVEITSPVNAVELGSSKQVVTLSPELIEVIAQRVVEKLSEKY